MIFALFAGAFLGAVVEVFFLGIRGQLGLPRESVLVIFSGLLMVLLPMALVALALRRQRQHWVPGEADVATGLLLGLAVGLAPLLGHFLPDSRWAALLIPLALALALGSRAYLRAPAYVRPVALLLPLGFGITLLLPSSAALLSEPASAPHLDGPTPQGPDVVLISVDTLRADRVEALADELPGFARLRAKGRSAPFGWATSNQTVPSHATLLTGLPAPGHGLRHNFDAFDPPGLTLAERFGQEGWATAGVLSNGLLRNGTGFERGFAAWDDSVIAGSGLQFALRRSMEQRSWLGWVLGGNNFRRHVLPLLFPQGRFNDSGIGRKVVERAEALMGEMATDPRPYFLFLHFMDPHHPYAPPPAYWENSGFSAEMLPPEWREANFSDNQTLFTLQRLARTGDAASLQTGRSLQALYDAEIRFVDQMLTRVLNAVAATGRPTVVLLTADHGEHFAEHGWMLHGNAMEEPELRVPFFLSGPGVSPGTWQHAPTLTDVAPTLLQLCGLPSMGLAGRNLSGVLESRPHISWDADQIVVRDGKWKWLGSTNHEEDPLALLALRNLHADPAEEQDFRTTAPQVQDRLMALALVALKNAVQANRVIPDAEQAAFLQALGYVEQED